MFQKEADLKRLTLRAFHNMGTLCFKISFFSTEMQN
jgi:hypothetical protein